MAYSLYTAFNILHQKSVLLGAVLLSLKIYLTFSGGFEGKELLASTYSLYRCSKNWYLVESIVSEEEADERRATMHKKVSGEKKETTNERSYRRWTCQEQDQQKFCK